MTTAEFERIRKEFGKLLCLEKTLNQIRKIRKRPEFWNVKFHDILNDVDIAFPCENILDMLGIMEDNITDEYEKQKQICDSIKQETP